MAPRWTHVVLKVRELDRSIRFYRELCGLELVRDGRPGGHTVWLAPAGEPAASPSFVLVLYQHALDGLLDHLGFQCASRDEVDRARAAWADGDDRFGAVASELPRIPAPPVPWAVAR